LLPVPWQIVTCSPELLAEVTPADGASIARASIDATPSQPSLRITETRLVEACSFIDFDSPPERRMCRARLRAQGRPVPIPPEADA